MPDILHITTRAVDGGLIVAFAGELDLSGAQAAHSAVRAALDGRPATLVVDLTRLAFMDSTGVAVLVEADRRAGVSGTRIVVVDGTGIAHRVLTVLGIDRKLEVVTRLPRLAS